MPRSELNLLDPKIVAAKLQEELQGLGQDVVSAVDDSLFRQWVADISPAIAEYAVGVANGNVKAKNELDIIRAIAAAKTARIAMQAGAAVANRMEGLAVFAAKLLATALAV